MIKRVLITGGSGLIGNSLSQLLTSSGFEVLHLSRSNIQTSHYKTYYWNPETGEIDAAALKSVYAIIHLAGAGIADKRWTAKRKNELRHSRIQSALLLLQKLKENNEQVAHFISASAIGFYDGNNTLENTEEAANGNSFIAGLCKDWENVAVTFKEVAGAVSIVRIGVVLSNKGGALPRLVQTVRYFMGAPLGNGKQYMPWIHLHDLSSIFHALVNNTISSGIYNAVANECTTNKAFTKELCKHFHRPLMPQIPAFILKIMFGAMSSILLKGNRVIPEHLNSEGFQFKYPSLKNALKALY